MPHHPTADPSSPAGLHAGSTSLVIAPTRDARSRLHIVDDRPMRLLCPADLSVTCVSGIAWLTIAGDTRDVVLHPGQRHVAARRDRLFINGMPECVLQVEPVEAGRLGDAR